MSADDGRRSDVDRSVRRAALRDDGGDRAGGHIRRGFLIRGRIGGRLSILRDRWLGWNHP